MAYTEIKERNGKRYFYRVISVRNGNKVEKLRKYLGRDLTKDNLTDKEVKADKSFINEKVKDNIDKIKAKIMLVLKKYKIKKASLFGSYARGDQKKNSDIDILIEAPKGIGFGFVGIAFELEKALKKKVDLLTYNGISPYFKKYILEDEVRIL